MMAVCNWCECADSKGMACDPVSAKTGENVTGIDGHRALSLSVPRYFAEAIVCPFQGGNHTERGLPNFPRVCFWALRATERSRNTESQALEIHLVYDLANPESLSHI
jgi:hypothetical protein